MPEKDESAKPGDVKATPWSYFWIALVLVGIGLLFVAWNYYVIVSSSTTIGTVLSVEKKVSTRSGSSPSSTVYRPLFSYVDESGTTRNQKTRSSSSVYDFKVGEELRIAYYPESSTYVTVVDWSSSMFLPKLCFGMAGLMMLLFGVTLKQAGDTALEG